MNACETFSHITTLLELHSVDIEIPTVEESASKPEAMGFNWRAYESWRAHPMLNNNLRHGLPGLGIASAAFAVYVVYDKTVGSGSKESHH